VARSGSGEAREGTGLEKLTHPGWCENLVRAGGLQQGEHVLVVVEESLAEEGAQLLAAVADAGGTPHLDLWAGERPFGSVPPHLAAAGKAADLGFFLAENPLGSEAGARFGLAHAVTGNGGRQIFMGFVDGALLAGELSQPAPDLREPARALLDRLADADEVHVAGAAGTDLYLRVGGRPWLTDALELEAGRTANYPGGEVFVAPYEDSATGVLVADLTVPYTVEGLLEEAVVLRFEGGRVTSIEGGRAAQMLRELVADAGKGADVIAELGIGLNPSVTPRGHVMLDEKAAGTAHVAIGRNTGPYGGANEAAIHVDCIFSAPSIAADGSAVRLP
jgi:hypothetical protein